MNSDSESAATAPSPSPSPSPTARSTVRSRRQSARGQHLPLPAAPHPGPLSFPASPPRHGPRYLQASAPASPPTPAPSPTPHGLMPTWNDGGENEDACLAQARAHFSGLDGHARQRYLAEVLNLCNMQQLSFVHSFVSPRLKKDPFSYLPNELCLRILAFVEDARCLARASQVSRLWRDLVNDDMAWKAMCEKHSFRRLSDDAAAAAGVGPGPEYDPRLGSDYLSSVVSFRPVPTRLPGHDATAAMLAALAGQTTPTARSHSGARSFDGTRPLSRRPLATSYKSHFKQRYMVETAWRHGGRTVSHQIHPDQGVVTCLHLTPSHIVVALDNAKIHVFETDGDRQRTLNGHVMGVWAMAPWGHILVSGGCDRDVRVWDMDTGESMFVMKGHTSTVRCLKMAPGGLAVSGSRDTSLRVWDVHNGLCRNVLMGHQASVRCLDIWGDWIVSGSYDTTAKIWSISLGRCLRTLSGHFSQIYAVAFDGKRIATGSLDTSVRIWEPTRGHCIGILQGHTSLVGLLQMRGDTLVTGGSDGSVRVWSLGTMAPVHRLAAHDNSVTSLQFDDVRIVSGGSDGRVKVWDLKTGQLVRELSAPADAVWRVAFRGDQAVIMASRAGRTIMEVWSFAPPDGEPLDGGGGGADHTRHDTLTPPIRRMSRSLSPASASARARARDPFPIPAPQQQQQQQHRIPAPPPGGGGGSSSRVSVHGPPSLALHEASADHHAAPSTSSASATASASASTAPFHLSTTSTTTTTTTTSSSSHPSRKKR
ncbi:MAG: hypothetical protein M1826_005111 [Phylliscum demangeonii]|nr:MAG: hypothetical protein M1826_005111 [Phylliscum demangeonii]